MSWAFVVTALVIVATPGTGVVYTVATALQRGRRAGLVAAVGCTVGIVPHLIAALTGLAALLYASSIAFQAVKVAGVVYLLYLAFRMWRDRTPLVVGDARARTAGQVVLRAVLLNLLNPKLTVFFFAFLPQFVHPGEQDAVLHLLGLSLVFMLLTLVVFALYGVLAAGFRTRVVERPRVQTWLRRSFAASYVLLAGRLALPER